MEELLRDSLRCFLFELLLRCLLLRLLLMLLASPATILAEGGVFGLAADASIDEVSPVDQRSARCLLQPRVDLVALPLRRHDDG